ncbi:MAG: saccharopine dehydrogenase NADP-binding domain-containing protein [Flavobacteriales bacterium]|nr:saccharopine dehydrogenase NADP-binding domain-containing protein [Flavobacteriales bacterium]
MSKILVIGAGMVGSAIAKDLSEKYPVTCADVHRESLRQLSSHRPSIATIELNVLDLPALETAIGNVDLVVSAVPGFLGFQTLSNIIPSGKPVVDISFFPEDARELDHMAKKYGTTVIVDCGVAPGMGNLILGHYDKKMKIRSFGCLVGGLPRIRQWPFEYKAPFSPVDVIEEYTRPARYVENGEVVTREALSDVEHFSFKGIGTLEAFNSDGLRSIIHSFPHIRNMKEKTLRYPGHAEKMRALKEAGFFSNEDMEIGGIKIKPLDVTSKLLFDSWKLSPGEEEFTVMRITIEGMNHGNQPQQVVFELYDQYDVATGISSMARTTGYTATAAVNWLIEKSFNQTGVFPPEYIGAIDGCLEYILEYQQDRGVNYTINHS